MVLLRSSPTPCGCTYLALPIPQACFSEEFPLKAQDMLPIAEVMARTGTHFENFKQFFSTKVRCWATPYCPSLSDL